MGETFAYNIGLLLSLTVLLWVFRSWLETLVRVKLLPISATLVRVVLCTGYLILVTFYSVFKNKPSHKSNVSLVFFGNLSDLTKKNLREKQQRNKQRTRFEQFIRFQRN